MTINNISYKFYLQLNPKFLDLILSRFPTINDIFQSNPTFVINCLGLAMHQVKISKYFPFHIIFFLQKIVKFYEAKSSQIIIPKIYARVINIKPLSQITDIHHKTLGKFISIRGVVVSVGNNKQYMLQVAHKCDECRLIVVEQCLDGRAQEPLNVGVYAKL